MIITSKKIDHSIKWVNLTKMKNKMSYLEIIATAPPKKGTLVQQFGIK